MTSTLGKLFNKAPVPLAGPTGVGVLSSLSNDTAGAMAAMGKVGTLFAIVNRTSNAMSQVTWRLYRKDTKGGRTEIFSHAALDLWNRPNPTTTGQLFREGTQQHIDLVGEGWWVISTAPRSNLPLELWYIRPDKMMPAVAGSQITGYVYRGPKGEKVPLRPEQVIMLKMPNPLDPWRGMGPVQSILTELDSYRFTAEWNRNYFRNAAPASGALKTDVTLSDPEFKRITTRWNEQHKGVSNAHRVAVLEGGLDWVPMEQTRRDMQFVELHEVDRDTIREAFGFPKAMLGAADDVNRANAEAAAAIFAQWLLVPRLERFKGALNVQLLPLYGDDRLEFDYVNPVPESSIDVREKQNSDSLSVHRLTMAGYDPADVLETYGMPPMGYAGVPKARSVP